MKKIIIDGYKHPLKIQTKPFIHGNSYVHFIFIFEVNQYVYILMLI